MKALLRRTRAQEFVPRALCAVLMNLRLLLVRPLPIVSALQSRFAHRTNTNRRAQQQPRMQRAPIQRLAMQTNTSWKPPPCHRTASALHCACANVPSSTTLHASMNQLRRRPPQIVNVLCNQSASTDWSTSSLPPVLTTQFGSASHSRCALRCNTKASNPNWSLRRLALVSTFPTVFVPI